MAKASRPKNVIIVTALTLRDMEDRINEGIDGGYKLLNTPLMTDVDGQWYVTMQLDNTNEMVNDLMKNIKGMKR